MLVEMRNVADIKPYPRNPRHNDHAVDAVAASLREFGFRQPLVLDEEGVIVVGSTRYKAALKLGLHAVPVHVATGLTPAQLKAYRLADNKTGEIAVLALGLRNHLDRRTKDGCYFGANFPYSPEVMRRYSRLRQFTSSPVRRGWNRPSRVLICAAAAPPVSNVSISPAS